MVIVCIREGFGNQLFTYACGYALAKERETELIIDTTPLDYGHFRKLELLKTGAKYDGRLSYGRKEDVLSRAVWNKWKRRKAIGFGTSFCREKDPWTYSPECFPEKGNIYLYGFWQSYHYFEKYEKALREMIVPRYEVPPFVREQMGKVRNEDSVAVHIRRGDYVHIGCVLSLCYYEDAIQRMRKELPEARFYVFSDDLNYAKEHLGEYVGDNAVFWEDGSEENTLNDFFLMSACRHQIIANSTYSWWAAYLNGNEEKKVYAPVTGNWKGSFYPKNWNKIEV